MKSYGLVFIGLLLCLTCSLFVPRVKAAWLEGWDFRIQIDIDSGDIDTSLSSFPVLIYLSASSGINNTDVSYVFDEIGANSLKIAVTVGEDVETFVEIEKWDYGSEEAWLWANVTANDSANTTLYLYYDNDHADNTAFVDDTGTGNSVNVWDSNFRTVQHMIDNSTTTVLDSTSNGNNGTKSGANQPEEKTGKIAEAQESQASNDEFINFGTDNSVDITGNALTIEAWFYSDTLEDRTVICKGSPTVTAPYKQYTMETASTELRLGGDFGGWNWRDSNAAFLEAGKWIYAVVAYDGAKVYFYKNGSLDSSPALSGAIGSHATWKLQTRSDYTAIDPAFWDGELDEIRISSENRTSSYIKASYESGMDDLLVFGTEQTSGEEPEEPVTEEGPFGTLALVIAIIALSIAVVTLRKK